MKRQQRPAEQKRIRKDHKQASRSGKHRDESLQGLPTAASDRRLYKHAGRWLNEPKHEHEIVLRATEIANRALRRVVRRGEVVRALTTREIEELEKTYESNLSDAVSKILDLLCTRGRIFSIKSGIHRFYAVVGVLDPVSTSPPIEDSRRQRVLKLVYQTVEKLGRAARMSDILEHATTSLEVRDLSPTYITSSVMSLRQEGDLRCIGSIRGDGKGFHLYLPHEFNLEDYTPSEPLTWLQAITRAFEELWADHTRQASLNSLKPRPLSTGEVKACFLASTYSKRYSDDLTDPMVFINALQQLAKSSNPVLRKLKRSGHKAILWAPADVKDSELDIGDAYANDIERISEAVRRAEHALARPVKISDIKAQIELDKSLQPNSSSSIFSILSEAGKESVSATKVVRRKPVTQLVHRVGKIADVVYYSTSKSPASKAFVEFGRLELRWLAMRVNEQLNLIEFCSLPCVATGRMRLIASELADILPAITRLRDGRQLCDESLHKTNEYHSNMTEAASSARAWLDRYARDEPRLPTEVDTKVPGWTSDELLDAVKPLYPRSQKLGKGSKLTPLIGDAIRRVNNPEYVNRFSKDHRLASE